MLTYISQREINTHCNMSKHVRRSRFVLFFVCFGSDARLFLRFCARNPRWRCARDFIMHLRAVFINITRKFRNLWRLIVYIRVNWDLLVIVGETLLLRVPLATRFPFRKCVYTSYVEFPNKNRYRTERDTKKTIRKHAHHRLPLSIYVSAPQHSSWPF